MSAETTNIDKQKRRHRPALWGMGAVVVIVSALFLLFLASVMTTEEDDVKQIISTEDAGS